MTKLSFFKINLNPISFNLLPLQQQLTLYSSSILPSLTISLHTAPPPLHPPPTLHHLLVLFSFQNMIRIRMNFSFILSQGDFFLLISLSLISFSFIYCSYGSSNLLFPASHFPLHLISLPNQLVISSIQSSNTISSEIIFQTCWFLRWLLEGKFFTKEEDQDLEMKEEEEEQPIIQPIISPHHFTSCLSSISTTSNNNNNHNLIISNSSCHSLMRFCLTNSIFSLTTLSDYWKGHHHPSSHSSSNINISQNKNDRNSNNEMIKKLKPFFLSNHQRKDGSEDEFDQFLAQISSLVSNT